jgi:hypothetical protein
MIMARINPMHDTTQKRSRFLPCSGLPKLHIVLIKYEKIVAIAKAAPLAIEGGNNTLRIKVTAISTCNPVASKPEIPKRNTRLVSTGATVLALIGGFEDAEQRDAEGQVEVPEQETLGRKHRSENSID